MLQNLDLATLKELASHEGYPAVSLFMPTHRAGGDKQQDPVRLKNLIADALRKLTDGGMRGPDADALMASARELHQSGDFWRDMREGLAIFVAPEGTRWFKLDLPLPEQAVVGPWFFLRPLVPAWTESRPFLVLALSGDRVSLYRADRAGIEPVELPAETPLSLDDELKYDVWEEEIQYRSGASGQPNGGAMFHGHGGEKDAHGAKILRFVEHVAKGVSKALGASTEPLVLAGVDDMIDAYRLANAYPHLADARVSGSPDMLSPEQLRVAAADALAGFFDMPVRRDLDELAAKDGTGLVSREIGEILPAAFEGRVKILLLADDLGPLGTFDLTTAEVDETTPAGSRYLRERMDAVGGVEPDRCAWDLVDRAIAYTLQRDGEVHAFRGEDTPVEGVAAIYRY